MQKTGVGDAQDLEDEQKTGVEGNDNMDISVNNDDPKSEPDGDDDMDVDMNNE